MSIKHHSVTVTSQGGSYITADGTSPPCRTVILTGIFDHVADAEAHEYATLFPMDLLIDRFVLWDQRGL